MSMPIAAPIIELLLRCRWSSGGTYESYSGATAPMTKLPPPSSSDARHGMPRRRAPARPSAAAHAERVRHAVDVVEPGGDQGDLQDPPVVEARGPQPLVVRRGDARRVLA